MSLLNVGMLELTPFSDPILATLINRTRNVLPSQLVVHLELDSTPFSR